MQRASAPPARGENHSAMPSSSGVTSLRTPFNARFSSSVGCDVGSHWLSTHSTACSLAQMCVAPCTKWLLSAARISVRGNTQRAQRTKHALGRNRTHQARACLVARHLDGRFGRERLDPLSAELDAPCVARALCQNARERVSWRTEDDHALVYSDGVAGQLAHHNADPVALVCFLTLLLHNAY